MILTAKMQYKLSRIWFLYGNGGKKSTMGNHRYIQELIERTNAGTDVTEQLKNDQEFFSAPRLRAAQNALTQECIDAVNEILNDPENAV